MSLEETNRWEPYSFEETNPGGSQCPEERKKAKNVGGMWSCKKLDKKIGHWTGRWRCVVMFWTRNAKTSPNWSNHQGLANAFLLENASRVCQARTFYHKACGLLSLCLWAECTVRLHVQVCRQLPSQDTYFPGAPSLKLFMLGLLPLDQHRTTVFQPSPIQCSTRPQLGRARNGEHFDSTVFLQWLSCMLLHMCCLPWMYVQITPAVNCFAKS